MKTKITSPLFAFAFCIINYTLFGIHSASAQSPNKINYQAVARNSGGDPIVSTPIYVEFKIWRTTAGGTLVYDETHSVNTNPYGLFTLEIGGGTVGFGTFSTIPWGTDLFFLEVFVDPDAAGGAPYSSMGTTQFLSVPYAMHSATAGNGLSAGTAGQTVRHDGSSWIGTNSIFNDGTKVGIGSGTVTPTGARLQISGNTIPLAAIDIEQTSVPQIFRLSTDGGANFNITDITAGGFNRLVISPAGNVAIGNGFTPSAKLDILPSAAGALNIQPYGAAAGNTGEFRLGELVANGTNYVGFKGPDAVGANKIWTLPNADGTSGQVLSTNGAGVLGWASAGAGTVTGTGTANYIPKWTGVSSLSTTSNIFDDGTFVGIGTSTPSTVLEVVKTGGAVETILARNSGSGTTISSLNTGTGLASFFGVLSATNSSEAVYGTTSGTGRAAYFEISNTSNAAEAAYFTTQGLGVVGSFFIGNAGSSSPVIYAQTLGTGLAGEFLGKIKTTNFQMTNGGAINYVLTSDASGNANWAPPVAASNDWKVGGNTGTADGTNFIGTTDNVPLTFKVNGQKAGRIDQLNSNTFFGYWSGLNNTANQNSAYGTNSLLGTTTGGQNVAIGVGALQTNTSGSNNTAIGAFADVSLATLTNATAVGANAVVSASNSLILGNNANVGIGTATPTQKLEVNGSAALDGVGVSFWTGYGSNYIKLSEGDPAILETYRKFRINVNSQSGPVNAMDFDLNGNVGIGTSSPTNGKLDVQTSAGPAAVNAMHTGIAGNAGYFQINNASNNSTSLYSGTLGGGYAGLFTITNTASTADALYVSTNGTGKALNAVNNYTGNGILYGVYGAKTGTDGGNSGTGYGVYGTATGGALYNMGGYFTANGALINIGVEGYVYGAGTSNYGIWGENVATGTGAQYGVYGKKSGGLAAGTGYGVYGNATGSATNNVGGYFSASGATNNYSAHLDYGHLKSTGPSPVVTGGTLLGASVVAGSTDIKGIITSTGAVPNNSTSTVIVDFNQPYAAAPIVVVTAAGSGANVYRLTCAVTSISATSFTITLYNNNTGGGIPSPSINYIVIE